ncbi:MAG: hypothetical protein IKY33_00750 [Clostridia bacterium]|nr:hypothetical protein [Clostridia bacterium]
MKPIVDMHTHTFISVCSHDETANVQNFIDKAAEVGIQVLGITNHCWDSRMPGASPWYAKQDIAWVKQIEKELPVDTKGIKLYIGIESEYCGMSDTLGISAEGAAQFDYVLIPHTHTHMKNFVMPRDPIYNQTAGVVEERMRAAFPEVSDRQIEKWMSMNRAADLEVIMGGKPEPDYPFLADFLCKSFVGLLNNEEFQKVLQTVPAIVAHPFNAVGYTLEQKGKMLELISDEKFIEMFTLMAEKGVGYDISVTNFKIEDPENCQMFRIIKLAKKCGVKFIFGTDTHSVAGLKNASRSTQIFELAGFDKEDLHPLCRDFVK